MHRPRPSRRVDDYSLCVCGNCKYYVVHEGHYDMCSNEDRYNDFIEELGERAHKYTCGDEVCKHWEFNA